MNPPSKNCIGLSDVILIVEGGYQFAAAAD
jgi:hypothetical protein